MAQAAARTGRNANRTTRSPRQLAIARNIAIARRTGGRKAVDPMTVMIKHKAPSLVSACIEAAGFEDHHAY
jgi:hypothetical protein